MINLAVRNLTPGRVNRSFNMRRSLRDAGFTSTESSEIIRSYMNCDSRREVKVFGSRFRVANARVFRYLVDEILCEVQYASQLQGESPVIFDCGANLGLASLYFRRCYPHAKIVAFEAAPDTFALLAENVAGMDNIHAHHVALWDREGTIPFFVSTHPTYQMLNSIDAQRTPDGMEVSVRAAQLSSFIDEPIDLLKIDVEGAEWAVLEDLVSSGKIDLVRNAIIEYHHNIQGNPKQLSRFLAFLEAAGFQYQIDAQRRPILRPGFQDVLIGAYRQ